MHMKLKYCLEKKKKKLFHQVRCGISWLIMFILLFWPFQLSQQCFWQILYYEILSQKSSKRKEITKQQQLSLSPNILGLAMDLDRVIRVVHMYFFPPFYYIQSYTFFTTLINMSNQEKLKKYNSHIFIIGSVFTSCPLLGLGLGILFI